MVDQYPDIGPDMDVAIGRGRSRTFVGNHPDPPRKYFMHNLQRDCPTITTGEVSDL
jgi:hypothetical protein